SSIGEVYLEQKEYTAALEYQRRSLALYNEVNDQAYATYPLLGLGKIHLARKQFTKAIRYLNEALQIAQERGKNDVARDATKQLALAYEGAGNYREAYKSLRLYKTIADSLNNQEVARKITAQSMQFEFDKKQAVAKAEAEKKELVYQQELERQGYYTKAAIGGVLASLIIAGLIFGYYQQKRRDNRLLAKQNEEIRLQSKKIAAQRDSIEEERHRSEKLLLNILPRETAQELKKMGRASPKTYEKVTVLFTDFIDFTKISEEISDEEIVANLDYCFKAFDRIVKKHKLEKVKTIGDAYMCAGGIPTPNDTNPVDALIAAQEMIAFMRQWAVEKRARGEEVWELRLGIHTGKVVAGVVGEDKFAYDIWGDTVNIASRMESCGEPNKINISGDTYEMVKDQFHCEFRGRIAAKNKGEVDMYFVESRHESKKES
ncbi:MAG: adenylate/guanylate cyclase domain-containing protein, partial [Saprospiraceae bacterium]|nr:adenylate/guanylate cyclase domain-containing protein [Saprospiraceae bacterium]